MTSSSSAQNMPIIPAYLSARQKSSSTVILIAVAVAALAISAQIKIPFYPVPVTMQTLVVLLVGMSYGLRLGAASLASYLVLGAMGAPVFASGAGLAYMVGPTGGYLAGFFVSAVIMGMLAERGWSQKVFLVAGAMIIGHATIYLMGAGWLSTFIGLEKAITAGVLPFLYGDLLKLVIAAAGLPFAWSLVNRLTK